MKRAQAGQPWYGSNSRPIVRALVRWVAGQEDVILRALAATGRPPKSTDRQRLTSQRRWVIISRHKAAPRSHRPYSVRRFAWREAPAQVVILHRYWRWSQRPDTFELLVLPLTDYAKHHHYSC